MRFACPAFLFAMTLALWPASRAGAQPTVRADKAYEDTVRILILSNDSAKGNCGPPTDMVGIRTRDFVRKSLTGIPNVAYRESRTTQWEDVKAVWPGKLPHVIVHVNAGWSTQSGNYINAILNTAADSGIGVVSIGDDAAAFADKTFGFKNVDNQPQPMGDASQFRDAATRLWLDLDRAADTVGGGGIIRNTVDSLKVSRLFFNPVQPYSGVDPAARYRCQADADKYAVDPTYADKVTFMGFQRAFDGTDTVAGPRDLQTIVSFQDDVRRGVALSYQPQFLADEKAAHQIDYDAVIYASFAHFFREPGLHFTDETGRALAPGADWSPAKGKLYLSYSDDFVRADLAKAIILRISNGGGAPADSETITVAVPVKASAGKGSWRGEIPLAAVPGMVRGDGTVQVVLPSVINATVFSHDENGIPDGGMATAQLILKAAPVPPPVPPKVDTVPLGIRAISGFPAVSASSGTDPVGGAGPLKWIPPVGYRPDAPFVETLLPVRGQPAAGVDASAPQGLPRDAALVRVMSAGKYLARVFLFDNLGVFVKTFSQSFGYKGELENPARKNAGEYQSFLLWDRRDQNGRRVGQGVYIWRIEFIQENGQSSWRTVRTGLLR